MWSQVLSIVWFFLAVAMVAGVALGIAWQRMDKKPTAASEEIGTLKTKLKAAHEEYDACQETRKELESRVGDLEKSLVSSKSRTAELEVRLRIMEAEKVEKETAPVSELVAVSDVSEPADSAVMVSDSTEAATWASLARSMDNDDLEEIHGVGEQLALLLHEQGVHTFRQIALWSEEDVDRIEDKLPEFQGRIRRENWVQSAQECHWRKYNEAIGGYAPPPEA